MEKKEQLVHELLKEIEELKYRLQVAEDTLEAIRTGQVDALAIQGKDGHQIFTLETADRTYRTLVERMNEGAVTLNQEGIILYSNAHFAKLANMPLTKVIGTDFSRFLPVQYLTEYNYVFKKGWQEPVRGDFIFQPAKQEYIHVHLSFSTIEEKDGIVLGLIITDLTEIKKTYNKLQHAQEELKELNTNLEQIIVERTDDVIKTKQQLQLSNEELSNKNEMLVKTNNDLDNFIYTASHDLKAPISNIEGLIGTLKDAISNNASADIASVLSMFNESVRRFKATILDLTDISKVQREAGNEVEEINFTEVIEDVKLSIFDMISTTKAHIVTDTSACNSFRFSKKNFNSIVYNLISNAIKYRNPKRNPEIVITTEKAGNYILFKVQDNGLGIAQKNLPQVFTMFKRFHDHVEGTGVGLYIVKRIVDNAGGKIEVESEVGKGTTFKVYFI